MARSALQQNFSQQRYAPETNSLPRLHLDPPKDYPLRLLDLRLYRQLAYQNPTNKATNHARLAFTLESSSRTQHLHIPSQMKPIPMGPKIPNIPHGNRRQNDIFAKSTRPKNIGIATMTQMADRKKSVATVRDVSQSSPSHALGSQNIPSLFSFIRF